MKRCAAFLSATVRAGPKARRRRGKWTSWTVLRESGEGVTFVTFTRGIERARPGAGVTFGRKVVTFCRRLVTLVRDGRVPGAGEVGMPGPIAEAIGALAAHPGGGRRARDAAGLVQGDDELHLPIGGPAVPSTSLRTGPAAAAGVG